MENKRGKIAAFTQVPAQKISPCLPLSMGIPGQFAQSQQAVGGDAFVRHHAEQLAGWQAGIFHEPFKIATPGKGEPDFP